MTDFFQKAADVLTGFSIADAVKIVLLFTFFYIIFAFFKRHAVGKLSFVVLGIIAAAYLYLILSAPVALVDIFLLILIVGILILMTVVFNSEVRRAMLKLNVKRQEADHYTNKYDCSDEGLAVSIGEIVRACTALSKNNVGALIVLVNNAIPAHIIDSGTKMNSLISAPLLESIFNTKAPLHDGAVLVKGDKILASGCFLPLSQSATLPKEVGTRHRAAVGVTESYDVLAVIVSEQTGVISVSKGGNLSRYCDSNMLQETLEQFFGLKAVKETARKRRRQ